MSRSLEGQGHNAACLWKGLDLSNNLCKYEVNQQTNEKGIRGKQTYTQIVNDAGRPIFEKSGLKTNQKDKVANAC